MPSGSRGSSTKVALPVSNAVPTTSVMIAGRPWAVVWPVIRPTNRVPMIESWANGSPTAIAPRACSKANRADVPEPHGDRSTSPSAKIVTLR